MADVESWNYKDNTEWKLHVGKVPQIFEIYRIRYVCH